MYFNTGLNSFTWAIFNCDRVLEPPSQLTTENLQFVEFNDNRNKNNKILPYVNTVLSFACNIGSRCSDKNDYFKTTAYNLGKSLLAESGSFELENAICKFGNGLYLIVKDCCNVRVTSQITNKFVWAYFCDQHDADLQDKQQCQQESQYQE